MSENVVIEEVVDTESLWSQFHQKIEGIEISAETIMTLLRYSMEVVELSSIKGPQQKEMALKLLTLAIEDSCLDASHKETYLNMVKNGVVGTAVDLIVDATKGKLAVNKTIKQAKGILVQVKNVINGLVSCYRKMK
jgi:hypothetical protein